MARLVRRYVGIKELATMLGWTYEYFYRQIRSGRIDQPTHVLPHGVKKWYTVEEARLIVEEVKKERIGVDEHDER
jgi:hypothetical protein